MMAAVRALQREHGGVRCAERAAAEIAEKRLAGNERIDNMAFGISMASQGLRAARTWSAAAAWARRHAWSKEPIACSPGRRLARRRARRRRRDRAGAEAQPFYAGCALPQDHEASRPRARGRRPRPAARRGRAAPAAAATRRAAARTPSTRPTARCSPSARPAITGLREAEMRRCRSGRRWSSTPRDTARGLRPPRRASCPTWAA